MSESMLRELLGDKDFGTLTYRPDSAEIARWHGLSGVIDKVADPHNLMSLMGVEI